MNDLPRQKLQELISQYGRSLCDDPRRCEAMLKDLCKNECKREITVLISALRENVPAELIKQTATLPIEAITPKLAGQLYEHLGIAKEFANWAVESWVLALGLIVAPLPMLKKATSDVSKSLEVLTPPVNTMLGQNFTVDLGQGVTLEMIAIPGGTFLMGSPESDKESSHDERPQHTVTIQPFYMGKYPVTQAQWRAVMVVKWLGLTFMGDYPRFEGANRPVENVSWDRCRKFLKELNTIMNARSSSASAEAVNAPLQFRLPSEAEWEYACRAGTQTTYYFGDDSTRLGYYAWFKENSARETHPVGEKQPNALGLYDMLGNVWEWCADRWHYDYTGAPIDGSVWGNLGDGIGPVLRGGAWNYPPSSLRCANRHWDHYNTRSNDRGVRLVCTLG